MQSLESVVSKLNDVLAAGVREHVKIEDHENADFERAKQRLSTWRRRRSA